MHGNRLMIVVYITPGMLWTKHRRPSAILNQRFSLDTLRGTELAPGSSPTCAKLQKPKVRTRPIWCPSDFSFLWCTRGKQSRDCSSSAYWFIESNASRWVNNLRCCMNRLWRWWGQKIKNMIFCPARFSCYFCAFYAYCNGSFQTAMLLSPFFMDGDSLKEISAERKLD